MHNFIYVNISILWWLFFNVFFLFYIDRRLFPDPRDSHPSCWILQTHVICGITGILTLNWHQINQISARTNWTTIFSKQKSIMTTFSSRLYHYKRVTFLLMMLYKLLRSFNFKQYNLFTFWNSFIDFNA